MNKGILFFVVFALFLCSSSWSQTAVQPPGGGRFEDPYFVSTLEHLYYIALHPEGGYFVQTADIDATATRNWFGGKGFLPIGNSTQAFRGGYEGNGHVIKGLYINRPELDDVGLFGELLWGQINGVGLINADITGKNNVGGICGSINFTNPISHCFVTGSVTGNFSVGGLFGAINDTEVSFCYSNCNVKSNFGNAGGLIGSNAYSLISSCYAIGNVIGSTSVGGLVGFNFSGSSSQLALVSGCYASVSVKSTGDSEAGGLIGYNTDFSIVSNSYWNAEIAGTNAGYGTNTGVFANASGLTTDQMKQSSSFAGWNFSGTWKIRTAQTYPALEYVANNAPFAFREVISQHAAVFEILPLLSNDYDYETLQTSLVLKITGLSAGSHDNVKIYFPASAHMGDTLTVTYKVGEVITAHNDTLWGNTVSSLLVYSNQAPVITAVPSYTIQEDSQLLLSQDEITASDPDNDPYTIQVFPGEDYVAAGLTISPAPDFNGILRVGIGATDGAVMSDTAYMEITVNSVNDVPEINEVLARTMLEDSSLLISLNDVVYTDPDGDDISLIVGEGINYSVGEAGIIPSLNFNGHLSVPLSVTDGTDTSGIMLMNITVTPVNDAPVIVSEATLVATEQTEYSYTVIASDVDHSDLSYTLTWRPADMTISAEGIITWIPAEDITTSGTVTVVVSDGEYEDAQTFIITVISSNSIPVVHDTAVVTSENVPISVDMPATDPDGTVSTIAIDSDPLHGTTRRSGLTISYTPDANFTGKDSLTWYAVDNNGALSAIATMVITVNDVNYAPEITSTASVFATGGVLYTYTVIATDADEDDLSYSLSNQPEGMTIDDNGIISWLPGGNILTSGEITLTVSDGVLEDTEVFTITVSQATSSGTLEEFKLTIYPNPCRDYFTIDAGEKVTSLSISEMNGNLVHTQQVQGNCSIDVSHLMNGFYIVTINGQNIKLIKSE